MPKPATSPRPRSTARFSKAEKAIFLRYTSAYRKLVTARQQIDDAEPFVLKLVRASGGRLKVRDFLFELGLDSELIYSAEVQELQEKLDALMARERSDGTAIADPARARLKVTHTPPVAS